MAMDRSLIIDMSEDDLDEFTCSICHEIFTDPMVTPCCRQTYCNSCICHWLNENSNCPNDRKPLFQSSLSGAPRFVVNLLNNMKIKCKYFTNGCKTVGKVPEMERHHLECRYSLCEICGLGQQTDEEHNCLQNFKIKIESISAENSRLRSDNLRLSNQLQKVQQQLYARPTQSAEDNSREALNQNKRVNELHRRLKLNNEQAHTRNTEQYPDETQLFVGNLPLHLKEGQLVDLFSQYGTILDIRIIRQNQRFSSNKKTTNYGFVTFESRDVVQQIIRHKPIYFDGFILNVETKKSDTGRGGTNYFQEHNFRKMGGNQSKMGSTGNLRNHFSSDNSSRR